MAESKSSKKGKGGTRNRYDEPVTVGEPVDELPPRQHSSKTKEVLEEIQSHAGKWVPLDTGGRQPNSVQSMISAAANKAGMKVEVSVRGGQVFARAKK